MRKEIISVKLSDISKIIFGNRMFKNASWIIACKIAQSVFSLIITMLSSRYLGPNNYGLINYAAAVVSFFCPIMQLGFNSILVKELVADPQKEGEILGSAIIFSFISAIATVVGVISFAAVANKGETETIIICALYSILLLFRNVELLQYWFQTKLLSKVYSLICFFAYIIMSVYKLILLITKSSLYLFAVSSALDYLIIAIGLLIAYNKLGTQKLRFSYNTGRYLLSRGKYFVISWMMISVFLQTDKVMLKIMIGAASTGFYTAASTCAGLLDFIYSAVIDSVRPVIYKNEQESNTKFQRSMSGLYSLIIYMTFFIGSLTFVLSNYIIHIIYGKDYESAVSSLKVLAFYPTFVYMGTIRDIWILSKGKHAWVWKINCAGAVSNIILNSLLIPVYGVEGAATATILTQIIANIVVTYIITDTRESVKLLIKGLNPKQIGALLQ